MSGAAGTPAPSGRGGCQPTGVITWRNGTVSRLRRESPGAIELEVTVSAADGTAPVQVRALAYPALTGRPEPGDRVLLNTTALDLRLGTGGYARWWLQMLPDRLPPDRSATPVIWSRRGTHRCRRWCKAPTSRRQPVSRRAAGRRGHRRDAGGGGRPAFRARPRPGWPVAKGMLTREPTDHRPSRGAPQAPSGGLRAVYVMTDGGALQAWFSRTCATLREGAG